MVEVFTELIHQASPWIIGVLLLIGALVVWWLA